MDDRTVVGWNASTRSEAALAWALDREAPRHGGIELVFVVEDGAVGDEEAQRQLAVARAALHDTAERVRRSAPGCEVTTTAVRGAAAVDTLLDYVHDDWVLAVGAVAKVPGRARSAQSVGARLAAAALGPVAVIPDRDQEYGVGVVVGIDGSAAGDVATIFGAHEALRVGEPLLLVHAWNEPVMMQGQPILDSQFVEALSGESRMLLVKARELVSHIAPDLQVSTRSVHGPTAMSLVRAATGARELVLGSRGLRGIRRILLGSVSRSVLSRAYCPTIIVGRPAEPVRLPADDEVGRALAH